MDYKVFQSDRTAFMSEIKECDLPHFNHVANVKANDPEVAFMFMNTWEQPEKVERLTDRVRSLSVGDILVDEDGNGHIVDLCGFADLEPEWVAKLGQLEIRIVIHSGNEDPTPTGFVNSSWCGCGYDGDGALYKPDNVCECGVGKHHYHCPDCGGIVQIG